MEKSVSVVHPSLLGLWGSLSHEAFEISKERARIVYVRHLPNMPLLPGGSIGLTHNPLGGLQLSVEKLSW